MLLETSDDQFMKVPTEKVDIRVPVPPWSSHKRT